MTETIANANAATSTLFLGHNGEWWDSWLIISVIAAALVATAIGVTTAGSIISHKREGLAAEAALDQYKLTVDAKVADAKTEGIEAGKTAGNALVRAAELEKEAAGLRLELARLSTPRSRLITPEAAATFVEKIKPFAGTKIDIGHAQSGREQWDFLWVLEPLFPQAGWIFVDWNPGPLPLPGQSRPKIFGKLNWTMQRHEYGVANVSNVSIELSPEFRDKLLPAANALASALKEIGIAAVVEDHPISGVSATNEAIHFLVGERE